MLFLVSIIVTIIVEGGIDTLWILIIVVIIFGYWVIFLCSYTKILCWSLFVFNYESKIQSRKQTAIDDIFRFFQNSSSLGIRPEEAPSLAARRSVFFSRDYKADEKIPHPQPSAFLKDVFKWVVEQQMTGQSIKRSAKCRRNCGNTEYMKILTSRPFPIVGLLSHCPSHPGLEQSCYQT